MAGCVLAALGFLGHQPRRAAAAATAATPIRCGSRSTACCWRAACSSSSACPAVLAVHGARLPPADPRRLRGDLRAAGDAQRRRDHHRGVRHALPAPPRRASRRRHRPGSTRSRRWRCCCCLVGSVCLAVAVFRARVLPGGSAPRCSRRSCRRSSCTAARRRSSATTSCSRRCSASAGTPPVRPRLPDPVRRRAARERPGARSGRPGRRTAGPRRP